jgi:hypothetical protein
MPAGRGVDIHVESTASASRSALGRPHVVGMLDHTALPLGLSLRPPALPTLRRPEIGSGCRSPPICRARYIQRFRTFMN